MSSESSSSSIPLAPRPGRLALRENPRSIRAMLTARSNFEKELRNSMAGAVLATKQILTASSFLKNLCYPLKEGDVINKLLDQAAFELGDIGQASIHLNPQKFFKIVFDADPQSQSSTESYGNLTEQILESSRYDAWPLLRTIDTIKECKLKVLLTQTCFMVDRVQMILFSADSGENKSGELAVVPVRNKEDAGSSKIRISLEVANQKTPYLQPSGVVATLKSMFSQKLFKPKLESRLTGMGGYRMSFNPVIKEYQRVLRQNHPEGDSHDVTNRLNSRLMGLNSSKQDTCLSASLTQSRRPVLFIFILFLLGLLFSLLIDDQTAQLILQLLVFTGVVGNCLRMLNSPIYCHDQFKHAIRDELNRHYQQGNSSHYYETQPGGYDIFILDKLQRD